MNNQFFDKDLEEKVIGAMFLGLEDLMLVLSIIPHDKVFYHEPHQIIFNAIRAQNDKGNPIDMISISHFLKSENQLDKIGGAKTLAHLMTHIATYGTLEYHSRLVLEYFMKRKCVELAKQLLEKSMSGDQDVFSQIATIQNETELLLNQAVGSGEQSFGDIISETEKKWLQGSVNGLSGHSTGLNELDRICGGLTPGELTIVGARPGQGKTALVVTLIRNLAKQEIPCGIFSLEMSKYELAQRLASQESNVFAFKIKSGELNDYEKSILSNCRERMRKWNIRIFDEGEMNLRKLKTKAIMWQRKYGIKVLFVDYLQLMSGSDSRKNNRENEISEISRGLKILAKELSIPVIALSQLSRRVEERSDKMPQLSDLRESGAIEQDADNVWFLMRPNYYKMSGTVEINNVAYNCDEVCIIDQAKMRSGNTGQIAVKFDGPLMRMSNYDRGQNKF